MRSKILIYMALLLASCGTVNKDQAKVKKVNGLYIYVFAQPELKTVSHGNIIADQYSPSSDGIEKSISALAFLAKQKYPKAEALILNDSLNRADVVSFILPSPVSQ